MTATQTQPQNWSVLEDKVLKKIKYIRGDDSISQLPPNPDDIIQWALDHPRITLLCQNAYAKMENANEQRISGIKSNLNGAIFEEVALAYLRRINDKVASPRETRKFYRTMFPCFIEPIRIDTLMQESVPDGIIFEKKDGVEFFAALCEYTHAARYDFDPKIMSAYGILRRYPQVFSKSKMVVVSTEASRIHGAQYCPIPVEHVMVPISRDYFKMLAKFVLLLNHPAYGGQNI